MRGSLLCPFGRRGNRGSGGAHVLLGGHPAGKDGGETGPPARLTRPPSASTQDPPGASGGRGSAGAEVVCALPRHVEGNRGSEGRLARLRPRRWHRGSGWPVTQARECSPDPAPFRSHPQPSPAPRRPPADTHDQRPSRGSPARAAARPRAETPGEGARREGPPQAGTEHNRLVLSAFCKS